MSDENLDFLLEADRYQRQIGAAVTAGARAREKTRNNTFDPCGYSQAENSAKKIFQNFIKNSATLQINIDAQRRDEIRGKIELLENIEKYEKSRDDCGEIYEKIQFIFKEAREDIFLLIKRDSFQRFIKTLNK